MDEPTRAMLPPKDDLLAIYDRQLEWTIEKAAALNWLLCMERNRANREHRGSGDTAERYRNEAFPKGLLMSRPESHYANHGGEAAELRRRLSEIKRLLTMNTKNNPGVFGWSAFEWQTQMVTKALAVCEGKSDEQRD